MTWAKIRWWWLWRTLWQEALGHLIWFNSIDFDICIDFDDDDDCEKLFASLSGAEGYLICRRLNQKNLRRERRGRILKFICHLIHSTFFLFTLFYIGICYSLKLWLSTFLVLYHGQSLISPFSDLCATFTTDLFSHFFSSENNFYENEKNKVVLCSQTVRQSSLFFPLL